MNILTKNLLVVAGSAILSLSLFSPVYAQPLKGGFEASVVSQNILPIDAQGHILRIAESSGKSTASTGAFLNGWTAVNKELNDLSQGNGPSRGHVTFSKGPDSVTASWVGTTVTTLAKDGTPMTSSTGTWNYTAGSGKYATIIGSGTFRQDFTSETTYVVTFDGKYEH